MLFYFFTTVKSVCPSAAVWKFLCAKRVALLLLKRVFMVSRAVVGDAVTDGCKKYLREA